MALMFRVIFVEETTDVLIFLIHHHAIVQVVVLRLH